MTTAREAAEAFSRHALDVTYPLLADDVRWDLGGGDTLEGSDAVRAACRESAVHLAQVTTTFESSCIVEGRGCVVVDSTGRYVGADRTCVVASCDLYDVAGGAITGLRSSTVELPSSTRQSGPMATSYFTASSVDGFIADPEETLSWLLSRDIDPEGPMAYQRFMERVGAVVMGATTYRWVVEHEGGSWSYEIPAWVFSHGDLPRIDGADIRHVQGDVAQHHPAMLEAAGERDVWVVGGGDLAGQFADAGLLDELWVQYAPVALGAGAPLLPRHVELRLEEVARNRDFACARYMVVRPQA